MVIFAIILNLLISSFCNVGCLTEMGTNFILSSKATVECPDEVHRVDQIKVERMDDATILVGKLDIGLPLFDRSTDGKFPNLPSLLASADKPRIEGRDTSSDGGTNTRSNDSGTGYIELHDFITILSGFVFGYVVGSVLVYLIISQRACRKSPILVIFQLVST
jgi:hypothetical protein